MDPFIVNLVFVGLATIGIAFGGLWLFGGFSKPERPEEPHVAAE